MYERKRLVTMDLDSTLCNTGHRHHMIDRERGTDWHAYSAACVDDEVVEGLAVVARLIASIPDVTVVGLSARTHSALAQTMTWLKANDIPLQTVFLDEGTPKEYGIEYTHAQYKFRRLREVEEAMGMKCILHFDDYAEVAYEFGKHGVPVVCVRTPQEVVDLATGKAEMVQLA